MSSGAELARSLVVPAAAALFSLPLHRLARAHGQRLPPDLALAAGLATALATAQAIGMVLGFTHALRPWPTALALGAAALLALVLGARELGSLARGGVTAAPFVLLAVPCLLMATFPPWDRDEMVYHLALPRQFAIHGGYLQPDDSIFASLPLGWESIQAVLHTLGRAPGEPAFNPRLLGAWTAWGGALATTALAREAGAERLPWVAGMALLLTPTFMEFGASAYVEPYLVLVAVLGLVAVARAGRGERGWVVAAGVLAGVGASVKYTGLTVAALLAMLLLFVPGGARRKAPAVAVFVGVFALVGAPFYVRNALERGNPFFPMAYGLFGGRGWDAARAALYWETLRGYGAGTTELEAWTAPVRVFFTRAFERGFEGSIGPLPLLGLVLGVALCTRDDTRERPAPRQLTVFALLYTVFWALTVVQARFYLVAVAPLLALLMAGLERWAPRPAAAGGVLAATAAWGLGGWLHLWARQPTGPWLRGELSTDEALARVLPQSYPAERELEAIVPADRRIWLLWMRGYTYYLRRPYRLDSVYEEWRFAALLDEARGAEDLLARLHRDGIDYLLVNERFLLRDGSSELTPGRTQRLRQRFEGLVAAGALRPERRWDSVVLYAVGAP